MRLKWPLKLQLTTFSNCQGRVSHFKRGKKVPNESSFYNEKHEPSKLIIFIDNQDIFHCLLPAGKRIVINKIKIKKNELHFAVYVDGKFISQEKVSITTNLDTSEKAIA